jgi:hypothetical protein
MRLRRYVRNIIRSGSDAMPLPVTAHDAEMAGAPWLVFHAPARRL